LIFKFLDNNSEPNNSKHRLALIWF
jgi:hypothetical protein